MIGYLLDSSAVKKIPKIKPTMSEQQQALRSLGLHEKLKRDNHKT